MFKNLIVINYAEEFDCKAEDGKSTIECYLSDDNTTLTISGNGNMKNLYSKGVYSLSFFERPPLFDFHYYVNLAYTFADLICVVFIYDKQTDILVMSFHHFCTIVLIIFSYYNHFDSIGAIILYLHNFSDIFVYIGRVLLYTKSPGFIKKIFSG